MIRALVPGWEFVDDDGTFVLDSPHWTSTLYLPLVNEAGMMSAITPTLHGDAKTGQNAFLLAPTSAEDLHTSRAARNFWVDINDEGPWSATGTSAAQVARIGPARDERVTLRAGLLWQTLTRSNHAVGLRAVVTSFVPVTADQAELMKVELTNIGRQPLRLTPTAAIPIYGRSADNLRDHRHVTSLLHRITTQTHGVLVRPTLSFD
jgi:cellobiose phosphorylase